MGNEPTAENHPMPSPPQQARTSSKVQQTQVQAKAQATTKEQPSKPSKPQPQPQPQSSLTYNKPHPHQQYKPKKSNNTTGNNSSNGHNHNHTMHHTNGYKSHNLYNKSSNIGVISPSIGTVTTTNHTNLPKKEVVNVNKTEHFRLSTKMSIADFEILKLVGKGSFGEVWQVELKKSKQIYALKILKKKDLVARKQVTHTNTERRILANIDHPFLVSLRFAFQTKSKLFMVMDFFNGGELFFHLQKEGKFAETRARFYSAEICLAIECLHAHNITYRDLKPENILLDASGHIKITDFGLSKECIGSDPSCITRTFCGSPEYLAPEMLQQSGYNQMVDWWSYGTILYEMICGLPPFYEQNIQKMYQNILYAKIPFYHFMSRESIELISKLLIKNPHKRIRCEQIKLSAFFGKIDWEKLYHKQIEPSFKPRVMSKDDVRNFQQFSSSQSKKMYLKETPSMKSNSLMAAEGQFPNFTYDETTVLYVD